MRAHLIIAALSAIAVESLAAACAVDTECQVISSALSLTQLRATASTKAEAGLELLQRDAVAIDGKAKKESGNEINTQDSSDKEDEITTAAQLAADASLQAAQRAAEATAQVMHRNRELQIENE